MRNKEKRNNKETTQCIVCGHQEKEKFNFCPMCGKKQEKENNQEKEEMKKERSKFENREYKFYKKILAEGDNIYTMIDAINLVEDGYDVYIYDNDNFIMAITDRRKKKKGYNYLHTITPDFVAKVANDFCENEGKGIRIDNSCASWGIKFEINEKIIEEIINDIMQTEKFWLYN